MTEIVKCSKCGQKVDKAFAIVEGLVENGVELDTDIRANFTHAQCLSDNTDHVTCQLCDTPFKMITPGHLSKHDLTIREYKLRYGPVISTVQQQRLAAQSRINRGSDEVLRNELEGALLTIQAKDVAIVDLTEQLGERDSVTETPLPGVEYVDTGPRTIGVVFTMEEIENIGAVALREMVKLKFGRHESRKEQNIEKLRSLVE